MWSSVCEHMFSLLGEMSGRGIVELHGKNYHTVFRAAVPFGVPNQQRKRVSVVPHL